MKYFFALLPLFLFSCCQAQPPLREVRLDAKHIALLLDSTQAAQAITTDRYDRYFDLVTASEMSIQMHKPLAEGTD